jgi:hypothetical protein
VADVVLVLIVLVFFGLCVLYVRGCDRLIRGDGTDETTEPEPVREVAR